MDNLIISTPIELFDVDGKSIYVKREDLCTPEEGPQFSKIRGVAEFLQNLEPGTEVGVLDTFHSKAGWGVAWLCQKLGFQCHNFYPVYKTEGSIDYHTLRLNQQKSKGFGAILHPLPAGRSCILYHKARSFMNNLPNGIMLPNALKLPSSISATAKEVYTVPEYLLCGTWVISISSGTIAAGVMQGLDELGAIPDIILHMGYSRSKDSVRSYVAKYSTLIPQLVDEGYSYKDAATMECPFPCNEYYDLKAWRWLLGNYYSLKKPVIFWNIGA